jgi:hypothetical protein
MPRLNCFADIADHRFVVDLLAASIQPQKKVSTKKKKIAVLGWGSLIWDTKANQEFDRLHGKWMSDGPVLNLEFSRKSTSRAGALTLVIDRKHGALCTVVYAFSTRSDPAEAIEDLCGREGTGDENIGQFLADDPKLVSGQDNAALGEISAWAKKKGFDVVLWTALGGNFDAVPKEDFLRAAVKYVQELKAEGKARAAEYVWRAPDFVRTPLREALQKEPWFAPPAPIPGSLT